MSDILADAQETLDAFDKGDFVLDTEFARMVRGLLAEVKVAYESGYLMAWNERVIEGMTLDTDAAYNDWLSRRDKEAGDA